MAGRMVGSSGSLPATARRAEKDVVLALQNALDKATRKQGRPALERIWTRIVNMALGNQVGGQKPSMTTQTWAAKEIIDRLGGKPGSAVDVSVSVRAVDVSSEPMSLDSWLDEYTVEGTAQLLATKDAE